MDGPDSALEVVEIRGETPYMIHIDDAVNQISDMKPNRKHLKNQVNQISDMKPNRIKRVEELSREEQVAIAMKNPNIKKASEWNLGNMQEKKDLFEEIENLTGFPKLKKEHIEECEKEYPNKQNEIKQIIIDKLQQVSDNQDDIDNSYGGSTPYPNVYKMEKVIEIIKDIKIDVPLNRNEIIEDIIKQFENRKSEYESKLQVGTETLFGKYLELNDLMKILEDFKRF